MKRLIAVLLLAALLCTLPTGCAQVGDPGRQAMAAGWGTVLYPPEAPKEQTQELLPVPSEQNALAAGRHVTEMEEAGLLAPKTLEGREILWCSARFDFDFAVTDEKLAGAGESDCLSELLIAQAGDYIAVAGSFLPEHGRSRAVYSPWTGETEESWNCNFGCAVLGTSYTFRAEKYARGEAGEFLSVYIRNIGILQAADGSYYNNHYLDFTKKNPPARRYVLILEPQPDPETGYTVRQMFCLADQPQNAEERWLLSLAEA